MSSTLSEQFLGRRISDFSDMSGDNSHDGQRSSSSSTSRMAASSETENNPGNIEDVTEDLAALQRAAKLISRLHSISKSNPLSSTQESRESEELLKDIRDRFIQFPKRFESCKVIGSELRAKIASLEKENSELQEKVAFAEANCKTPKGNKEELTIQLQYFQNELEKEMGRRIAAEIELATLRTGTPVNNQNQTATQQQQSASHAVYEVPGDDYDFSSIAQLPTTPPPPESPPPLDAIIDDVSVVEIPIDDEQERLLESSVSVNRNDVNPSASPAESGTPILQHRIEERHIKLEPDDGDNQENVANNYNEDSDNDNEELNNYEDDFDSHTSDDEDDEDGRDPTYAPSSRPSSLTVEKRRKSTNSTARPVSNDKATTSRKTLNKSVNSRGPGRRKTNSLAGAKPRSPVNSKPKYKKNTGTRPSTSTAQPLVEESEDEDIDDNEEFEDVEVEEESKKRNSHQYNCDVCSKTYILKKALDTHRKEAHGKQDKQLICQFKSCRKMFSTYKAMQMHRRRAHASMIAGPPYKCQVCKKIFNTRNGFKWHQNYHDPNRKRSYVCPYCPKAFFTNTNLYAHKMSQHKDEPSCSYSHKCPKCSKSFKNDSELQTHVAEHLKKKFNCSICNKGFKTNWERTLHSKSHNNDKEKPFRCTIAACPKTFKKKSHLYSHLETHKGTKDHKCLYCDKAFFHKSSVNTHMKHFHSGQQGSKKQKVKAKVVTKVMTKGHKGPFFKCKTCGVVKSSNGALRTHMVVHQTVKPFSCDQCGCTFKRRAEVKIHVRRHHTGELPYLCDKCPKKFPTPAGLKKHTNAHLLQRNFWCRFCGQKFGKKEKYEEHERIEHPDLGDPDADIGGEGSGSGAREQL